MDTRVREGAQGARSTRRLFSSVFHGSTATPSPSGDVQGCTKIAGAQVGAITRAVVWGDARSVNLDSPVFRIRVFPRSALHHMRCTSSRVERIFQQNKYISRARRVFWKPKSGACAIWY